MSLDQRAPDEPTLSQRTFGNQHLLPRVPLPNLADSCERFIEWCTPLLSDEELAETRSAVEAFARPGGPGEKLHADLQAYNSRDDVKSWLDDFWPRRYLGRRDRIALNANFFFSFKEGAGGQIRRAAELITAALNYKLRLDNEQIPPALLRGQPVCMEQNKFLFSATRIPGHGQDRVRVPYSEAEPGPSKARHILVFHNRTMFRVDVIGENGVPHSLADFEKTLEAVKSMSMEGLPDDDAIGHLTTMARAEWADTRAELLAIDPINVGRLNEVETALFCICLEDLHPPSRQEMTDQLLHGDSGNRWFDKAVSLIVFGDGSSGVNIEHCGLDGTAVLAFVDALHAEDPAEAASGLGAVEQGMASYRRLDFVLNPDIKTKISKAAKSFADYARATATRIFSFQEFGTTRMKELGISPDAFTQLAFQLAHKRAKGFNGATYESIATRQYDHGRTEAMRVMTAEIMEFVDVMQSDQKTSDEKLSALRAAADKHVARARECQSGKAPEQHLWKLQMIKDRRGEVLGVTEDLTLFDTPGWLKMRNDYLSTSSAPSPNIEYFGFGSTSTQCIGLAYVLMPEQINIYMSTPRTVEAEMQKFALELDLALRDIEKLLDGQS